MNILPHAEQPAYLAALKFAVLADELAEQVPPSDVYRAKPLRKTSRAVAMAVAKYFMSAPEDIAHRRSHVWDALVEASVELDIFDRRAFVSGVDEAKKSLTEVAQAVM